MSARSRHGNTRRLGVAPVQETRPWREQGRPPAGAAPLVTGRDTAGRVRTSDAACALATLPRRFAFVPRRTQCAPYWNCTAACHAGGSLG
jgi:hypothetical protein